MRTTRSTGAAVVLALGLATACSGGGGTSGGGGDDPEPGEPAASGQLSLLTYNVAGLPQEISSENPEENIPHISPLLDEYDIVLTQEDFDWWMPLLDDFDFANYHDRLRADVTHEHRSAPHPGPEAAGLDPATRPDLQVGDGLGVLSRYPFSDETRVAWEGCFGGFDSSDGGAADCLSMKGFAMVRMTLADGAEVDVYNLHAEAGGTETDQQLQVDDFDQLAAFVEEHSEGRAVILGGDTNLHTESDHADASGGADTDIWAAFLERTGLADACHELDCEDRTSIDKVAFRSGDDVTLTPSTHDFPRDRFTSPEGDQLSDHPPLVVTFDWEA